jgi:uncharacterized protein YggE
LRILSSLALATAFSALMLGAAQAEATLTVTGSGTVETAPDMATVSLGVTTNGDTAGAALSANSAAVAGVIERLKAQGVDPADIQTSNLSLNPNWVSNASGASEVQGYVAMNMVSLRIRALDKTGALLDAAVADGANTLNGLYFSLQDGRAAEDEARKRAVADAKARAEALAAAAGTKLGAILSISEGGMAQPMPGPMYRMDAAAAVPVEAGSVGVTSMVTIVWQIGE